MATKIKRIEIRVDGRLYEAFTKYSKKHSTTKTKVIEDFLRDLLKEELKD